MSAETSKAVLVEETRSRSITLTGPLPSAEYCRIKFEWCLEKGAPEELVYDWEARFPEDKEPWKGGRGAGSWRQTLLPPDVALIGEALLKEWSAYTEEIYPRVPPLPTLVGRIQESRRSSRKVQLSGREPFKGTKSTFVPENVSIVWSCNEGQDRSGDRCTVSLSAGSSAYEAGRLGDYSLYSEYWEGGAGNNDDCSDIRIPDWLWELVDSSRQDLLAWRASEG